VNVRASNSIGYFLPGNLGGFYGQLQYYMGENLSNVANKKDGNGASGRIGFQNGPINVALAYSQTKYLTGDIKTTNIGGQYDLGVAKLMAHYNNDKIDNGPRGKGWLIGGLVPVGAGEIRVAYSTYEVNTAGTPEVNKLALGYVHNLSKRTALYTTFARLKNKGGAAQGLNGSVVTANESATGVDIGIRHSF
jgi:predicted porin